MVHRVEIGRSADNVSWQVYIDSQNFVTVDRTGVMSYLAGQQRQNNALVSQVASDVIQMLYDQRVLLTSLPADDPDRTVDPALPHQFHARVAEQYGQGQNRVDIWRPVALVGGTATHLVGRSSLLTVVYEGSIETARIETDSPPSVLR